MVSITADNVRLAETQPSWIQRIKQKASSISFKGLAKAVGYKMWQGIAVISVMFYSNLLFAILMQILGITVTAATPLLGIVVLTAAWAATVGWMYSIFRTLFRM